jgi:hypothetical protein
VTYLRVTWIHQHTDEPVVLFSELDDQRMEMRKVEVFRDGSIGWACAAGARGKSRLGEVPIPSLHDITLQAELQPDVIGVQDFERIWIDAVKGRELVAAIRGMSPHTWGLREADPAEAERITRAVGRQHVSDAALTWWWESPLGTSGVVLDYGSGDGVELLETVLRSAPLPEYAIAITDDEPPPWLVLIGSRQAIATLLRELHAFEYWVAPADGAWVVFDTHHNVHVVRGAPVEGKAIALGGRPVSAVSPKGSS